MGFLGIDPGLSGAIAYVYGGRLVVRDVPTVRVKVGKTFKRRVDAVALASILRSFAALGVDAALTENVNGWGRPKKRKPGSKAKAGEQEAQSASAAFAFGKVAGQLEQALACNDIPYATVAPAKWMRAVGLIGGPVASDTAGGKRDKTDSRKLASQIFPDAAKHFSRVKDDGRAEAALIAYYCARTHGQC